MSLNSVVYWLLPLYACNPYSKLEPLYAISSSLCLFVPLNSQLFGFQLHLFCRPLSLYFRN
ncbi:hypothetical protein CW304_29420 [Bacillus sp. UFRGS-B20]|nr:hypothetical protein CW304_29420 [Bacillus sp. UFRGS-B20]